MKSGEGASIKALDSIRAWCGGLRLGLRSCAVVCEGRGFHCRICAEEITFVKPEHQAVILREMEKAGDFSTAYARTLILRTPEHMRNENGRRHTPWNRDMRQKKALTAKLEEAEQRYEFYTGLYRQYVADLLKLCIYVRRLITNKRIAAYIKAHHPEVLERFQEVIFETEGKKTP